MSFTQIDTDPDQNYGLSGFPALASIRIEAGDLKHLAVQGFVCEERRGRNVYYKLRFRSGGKQVVRYIGGADRAGMVTEELARLQAESKLMHELRTGVKIANRMIREAKRAIEPVLKESGFVFHGLAVRKPRVRHP